MGKFKKNNIFYFLLLFWVALNVVSANYTELYADEAYYWMYAQFPDWGYFDHPPGVMLTIWLSNWIGKSELIVRSINILLSALFFVGLYKLVKPKDGFFFFCTLCSFLALHVAGFVVLPDSGFLFSALLFFYCYKLFLKEQSSKSILLLGTVSAIMIYFKYHGFLVLGFTLLSNLKLFSNKRVYLVGLITLVLLLPHILWLISNDFPSITYHLSERSKGIYKMSYSLEFLFGNIPFMGGLVAIMLFYFTFQYKATDRWEKAMKWNLYGTFIFFFLVSFKGQHIEPNWTIVTLIPMVYFGYKKIENTPFAKYAKGTAIFFALLMLVFRIHIISPFFVAKKDRVWDFHGARELAESVDAVAKDRPIMANRYYDASLLNFYLDKDYYIASLNIQRRRNQYHYWALEKQHLGKDVAFVNTVFDGVEVDSRRFKKLNVTFVDSLSTDFFSDKK